MSDTPKPTKISREGVILIKSFEGFRPRAIQRPDGRWTIGYGHTRSAREGLTVSEADAELLLQYDLIPVAKAMNAVQAPLNQHQFDALASFAFSIGVDRFETSNVLARLNAGAPQDAAEALATWVDDLDVVTPARRRATERALFFADPQAPASLAELLAAPLPPATATLVERTPDVETTADAVQEEAPEAAPFPAAAELYEEAAAVVAPWMTQDDVVAEAAAHPSEIAVEAADEIKPDQVEPDEAETVRTLEAEEASVLAEPDSAAEQDVVVASEDEAAQTDAAPSDEATDAAPLQSSASEPATAEPSAPEPAAPSPSPAARPTASPASFYSPYAVRALGPLAGFGVRTTIRPASAPMATEASAAPAEDAQPETAEPPTQAEFVPQDLQSDETPATEPAPAEPIVKEVSSAEPAPVAEAAEAAEDLASPAQDGEPALNPPPFEAERVESTAAERPIEMPSFGAFAAAAAEPAPLALTGAPDADTPAPRLVWPEHTELAHPDQTPLFTAEPPSVDVGSQGDGPAQPSSSGFRFEWTETLTFLVMGGIGLLSFGAAMAAFRQSSDSTGEIGLIGWVLVLIALACVGVSGFNLYQRWGRVDRA
ncbi:glycoside hydrolase family protein [Pseudomonas sp. ODNR1LW]|nr:glycoside hydrolase family protein [Pseudomonas sp. ODNR1LW]